jgi:hypothetical protein
MDPTNRWVFALLCQSPGPIPPHRNLSTLLPSIYSHVTRPILLLPTASSTMHHTPTKPSTPLPWLSGPASTPASCPDPSRAVWLAARLGLETPHPTCSIHPQKAADTVPRPNRRLSVLRGSFNSTPLSSYSPLSPNHNAPLHAHCQRLLVVVASVAEANYTDAFGGG